MKLPTSRWPTTVATSIGAAILAWMTVPLQVVTAQSAQIDFRNQIQPLLQERCIECHGPSQQMGGFRLDQRSSAIAAPGARRLPIQPGSSAYSLLYRRVASADFGPQMPPTGALPPAQIQMLKDWIDQGAEWPDALAGDPPRSPPSIDPVATRLLDSLRTGDLKGFNSTLNENPEAINVRDLGGSTPLMYAALYGDAELIRLLLIRGADPNLANHAGATALTWAVGDVEKTALLLKHGADPTRSAQGQASLIGAAAGLGSASVVKLLLDRGASPSGLEAFGALAQAANAGDEAKFRLLVEGGANLKAPMSLAFAIRGKCAKCAEILMESAGPAELNTALVAVAPFGDAPSMRALLDRGADVNTRPTRGRTDRRGRTPLMMAASSDYLPLETVKLLIDRGADVNAIGPAGETALDLAKRNGDTPVVDLLVRSGATEKKVFPVQSTTPRPATSLRAAISRSIPLLQRSDVNFIQKTGCVSCHNNSLTAMTVALARQKRFPVDEQIARQQVISIAALLDGQRDDALFGLMITNTASSILVGLAAERHAPDAATDAMAYTIKGRQLADGRWANWLVDHRPPMQGSDVEVTAMSIRALQAYAPAPLRAEYGKAIQRASAWLRTVRPRTTDERAMRLLGLKWAGVSPQDDVMRQGARELAVEQRADGGWAQLATLASDAHGTGQVLVALREAGAFDVTGTTYRRGIEFLLKTQLEDGSWYVKSRSVPFQPYFESGFPHGHDQWVSIGATNWAVMALALAAP